MTLLLDSVRVTWHVLRLPVQCSHSSTRCFYQSDTSTSHISYFQRCRYVPQTKTMQTQHQNNTSALSVTTTAESVAFRALQKEQRQTWTSPHVKPQNSVRKVWTIHSSLQLGLRLSVEPFVYHAIIQTHSYSLQAKGYCCWCLFLSNWSLLSLAGGWMSSTSSACFVFTAIVVSILSF